MTESAKLKDIVGSSQLQTLLSQFNRLDAQQFGIITLAQAIQYFQSIGLTDWDDGILRMTLINSNQITFDQFLVILHQLQKINHPHTKINKNYRLVQFIRLLEDYRNKCQSDQNYIEANRSYKKIKQIKDKQLKRQQFLLKQQQNARFNYVNSVEKEKLRQFKSAWKEYHTQFQQSSKRMIDKIRSRHMIEMEKEEQKLRRQFMRPRQTRALKQLKDQERLVAKMKDYQKAEKLKEQFLKLQEHQSRQHEQLIERKIHQRTQNLRKKQQTILMAQLKKIQMTKDLQQRRQKMDAQKLVFKLKKLKQQVQHQETVEYKNNVSRLRGEMSNKSDNKIKYKSVPKILTRNNRPQYNPETLFNTPRRNETKVSMKIRVNSFSRPRFEQDISLDDI